jgi:putative tryptophan/tyrosine transport system substrate-binding protein
MRRRDVIAGLGATAVWPLAAVAQDSHRVRGIAVLMNRAADNPEALGFVGAFAERLAELGWITGQNVRIDYRWYAGDADAARKYAAELTTLEPDIFLASGTLGVAALQSLTRSVPTVFTLVTDPVGAGFVNSLGRPDGNATGFMLFEYNLSGKWLELLKQIVPNLRRVAVLRDSANPAGGAQFASIQAVAPTLGVEVSPINSRDDSEIERAVERFVPSGNAGLIVTGSASAGHRDLIIRLAARHKLPAVYSSGFNAIAGGLISYGPDLLDQFRRAAGYVDRILKGEKIAELPVQAPTKYELVINLKTARALGLEFTPALLARADEVIE